MKHSGSQARAVLDVILEYTRRGSQMELTLQDGSTISRFRVYEVIAPRPLRTLGDWNDIRVRGVVSPDRGAPRDDYFQLRYIASVRDELLARYSASERFFDRHPLPISWVRLARCPVGRKGE
jgi:hypothetical protein